MVASASGRGRAAALMLSSPPWTESHRCRVLARSRCSFPGQLWHGRGSQTAAPTGWGDITQPPKSLLLDGLNLDQMCQQICLCLPVAW